MSKMNKNTVLGLAVGLALIVIIAPIVASIELARSFAFDSETRRVTAYARDVLKRSEMTADQVANGINRLKKQRVPCSDESRALMRDIDLVSTYIQAIGYVEKNRLVCSSIGEDVGTLELGTADLVTPGGVAVRLNAKFSVTGDTPFLVLERDNYAAIIHKDLPVDVTTDEEGVAVGTFLLRSRKITNSRGTVNPEWIKRFNPKAEQVFTEDGYIVAIVVSQKYFIGSLAAVPMKYYEERVGEMAKVLVPVGVLASVALAFIVFYIARQRTAMPSVIRAALRNNEFFLEYQPVVDLKTGRIVGAEALIRWLLPNGERVRPDVFIPVAEETGLIQQISQRVLKLVAHDAHEIFVRHPDFHVAVNLSAADFASHEILSRLRELIDATRARPCNLIVEITERAFMEPEVTRQALEKIRADGISVAVDDFGTGYSSLSYLETLEVDYLKIDKTFVDTVGSTAVTSHVVNHIIEMAKSLELRMVAEGVETEAQADFLREHGVHFAQGWLFGKPMPLPAIIDLLDKEQNIQGI